MTQVWGRAADTAYRWGMSGIRPLAPALLAIRRRRGKEDPERLAERRGTPTQSRPAGRLVWVHAASVGETRTVLVLIDRLTGDGENVLLTTGTVTSAALAGDAMVRLNRMPAADGRPCRGRLIHQYVPLDVPAYVARFLGHWQPDLAIFAESELWPVTYRALQLADIPLVLVNARLSDRSYRRWRVFPAAARSLTGRMTLCLAQTEEDARRYRELGARRVACTGNLKLDAPAPECDPSAFRDLRAASAGRPVLLAASTHPGEEELVLAAHGALTDGPDAPVPDLITVIAPRHPERGHDIFRLAQTRNLGCALRSRGEGIDRTTAVYVADTIGEMGLWYRLATVAFLGGSLVPHGGQNPIEAAKLGAPVIHGPHVANFREIYLDMGGSGAALAIADGAGLETAVRRLLADEQARREIADRAMAWAQQSQGAAARTLAAIEPWRRAGRRPAQEG